MLLKIQKELTEDDINYIAEALGYSETVNTEKELNVMSMQDFEDITTKEPERKLRIKLYKSDDEVYVIETITVSNEVTRSEYLAKFMQEKLNSEIEKIMLGAEKIKLQAVINEQEKQIAEGVKHNVEKTPLEVEIIK